MSEERVERARRARSGATRHRALGVVSSAAIALALLALAASAVAAPRHTLSLHTASASGWLHASVVSVQEGTEVRLSGVLRVRRPVALVVVRCASASCHVRRRSGFARKRLAPGERRVRLSLLVKAAPAVEVDVRAGSHVLAKLRLLVPAHVAVETPVAPAPVPPTGRLASDSFALSSSPGLSPSYSPSVPDYTVRCTKGQRVAIEAHVPAGESLTVDGEVEPSGGTAYAEVELSAGQAFYFTVVDGAGAHTHAVRCLPSDFPAWNARVTGTPQVAWLLVTPSAGEGGAPYVVIADSAGVPVWWMRTENRPADFKLLSDGTLAWSFLSLRVPTHAEIHSLDGTLLRSLDTVGTGADFHDLQLLEDGNYLMMDYKPRSGVDLSPWGGSASATVLDAEIQEITPEGASVWSWNSAGHIDPSETVPWGIHNSEVSPGVYDLVHLNSLQEDGEGIVFSGRHLDAVYRISRSDGSVNWKLGGSATPQSLTFVNDPLGASSFGGQHDARILPDGSLTVHDNGTRRGRAPRAVRYAIDPEAGTATLLETVTDPRVASSACCGSARRLPGGDWVMSWGFAGLVTELTPSGSPVLSIELPTTFSYRADPVLPGVLSREALLGAMDAMHPR
jgi:Arylsulfotransferase (ASST)